MIAWFGRRRGIAPAVALALLLTPSAAWAQPDEPADDDRVFDDKGREINKPGEAPKKQKVTLPELKQYAAPVHPADKLDTEASVTLKLTIDIDGKVVDSEVVESAGQDFDNAALEASRKLVFTPARFENGNPFKAAIKFKYEFTVQEVEKPKPAITTGILRGKVLMRSIDEPLAGATVTLKAPDGGEIVARTSVDGGFELSDLEPGRYEVSINADGYEELAVSEEINAAAEITATYRLNEELEGGAIDVFVEGDKPPREVTKRTIEQREINRIPGTKGDAIRSIENLPGVARPPAIAGVLLVRGSAPFDTQVFVDGVSVPLIYHFGGLSSVVPTEMLEKIDFYPGNFSAKYGRAMGGIVDVGIRSPRSDGYHGLAQLDLIDARLMFEGPIPLLDGWTFAAAGRRSYLDAWLGPALEEAGAQVTQAPRYYDYQFVVERKWKEEAKLRLSFYGSDDGLELVASEPQPGEPALTGNIGLSTAFQRFQIGYDQDYTEDDNLDVQIALARDALGFGFSNLFFELEVFSILGRAEYTSKLGRGAVMHVGLDVFGGTADVAARLPAPPRPGQPPGQPFSTRATQTIDQTNEAFFPAGYVEMELTPISRWRIVPGLRIDYTNINDETVAAPRINSRFDIVENFPRTTVKGGVGVYNQPPQFQQAVEPLGTPGVGGNRAIHYGLGVEQEITRQIEASLEGFYKQLDDIVVAQPSSSGAFVSYNNAGSGRTFGGELLLKYKPDDRFFGWVAYTLMRATRKSGPDEPEVQVPQDQTHILTLLGSVRLGHGWEFGARFRLVSGNLVDPNVCNSQDQSCDADRINALYHGATGAYTPIRFGSDNSERLPMYHSLDLRVDKSWKFHLWKLSAYLDIQNAYNNQNVEGILYDYRFSARQYLTGIPILPSLGLRGEF